jgi:hypothetical protein
MAEDNINHFKLAMDCWIQVNLGSNIEDFFQGFFYSDIYEPGKVSIFNDSLNVFLLCCNTYANDTSGGKRAFQLRDTLLLSSVIQYLMHKDKITINEFRNRIRILRNFINNSEDEIRENRMKMLLKESDSIIIKGIISIEIGGYNENQKRQEIEKQAWLLEHGNEKDILFRLEDHNLLRGSIDILGLEHPELFEKFILLFNGIDHGLIHRALLTFGDYSQSLRGGWRNIFGRDNTWRDLFVRSNQRNNFDDTKRIVCQLLSGMPKTDIEEYLNSLIKTYIADEKTEKSWRYYFVKYPAMNEGRSGIYCRRSGSGRLGNEYEIIMMNTSYSLSGYHWDPFLYVLSKEFPETVTLGNYNSLLKIKSNEFLLQCFNDCWELSIADGSKKECYPIRQDSNSVDIEDRLDIARRIINENI